MSNHPVLIIAEAGVNHNGDIKLAEKLIDVAAEAGADYVKFQTFKAENIVSRVAKKAQYQSLNDFDSDDSQFNMLKRLELDHEQHLHLIEYSQKRGIKFFSTAFDVSGLTYLQSLGFERFKVPSGEITNYPYLKKLAEFAKPVILSTGMANMNEIKAAIEVLVSEGLELKDITILHCNTEYPTPFEDVNLRAMLTIKDELGVAVGYSDHTTGIEVATAATALGAQVIEKHFTLDKNLPGPDHKASLEPNELKSMVLGIRNTELAMSGDGVKQPSESEKKNITVVRKSLHLKESKLKGELLKEEDLIALRPGDGISPMEIPKLLGMRLTSDLPSFTKLSAEHLLNE